MADGTGRVFGIDLGTTYSAIAYIDESGRPTVCRNDTNAEITPSVVQFESPTNVVVGETAKQSAFIDADSVVSLIKRRMGEDREYEFHGEVHTPESISALILRRLAADAASYTDGPVEQVVITVPAYFGARQKEATRKAGPDRRPGRRRHPARTGRRCRALRPDRLRRGEDRAGLRPGRRHLRHHRDPGRGQRDHGALHRRRHQPGRRRLGRAAARAPAGAVRRPRLRRPNRRRTTRSSCRRSRPRPRS